MQHPPALHRSVATALALALASSLLACDAPADGKAAEPSKAAAAASPSPAGAPAPTAAAPAAAPAAAAPAAAAATAPVDPNQPCSWLTTEAINAALSATLSEGTQTADDGRQIVTCNWRQSDPFGIVDLGVSQTPGAEAFETNRDLAPAYFDGDPKPITIAGAEQAYHVIKKGSPGSVIGMLVGGRFVLLQVAIDGVGPEPTQALAAQLAARLK